MAKLANREYLPLREDICLDKIPQTPGVYKLAVKTSRGYQCYYTDETDNLRESIWALLTSQVSEISKVTRSLAMHGECFFTLYAISDKVYRTEITKLVTQTFDPVRMLTVINCN